MNKMLMNSMNDIMKGTYQMTFHNIVKLIFLSQVSNIKQIAPTLYEYIKHMILYLLCFTKQIYYSIKSSKQYEMIEDTCIDDCNKPKSIYVDIEINEVFIKYFYNYLQTSKNCSFDLENINYNVKNCKDIITHKKISNIIITYENIDIKINTPIYLKINTNINNIESYTLNDTKKKITSLFDCLKPEQTDVIKKVINKEFNGKTNKEIIDVFENNVNNKNRDKTYLTEFHIVEVLFEKYNMFDKDELCVIILIISLIHSILIRKNGYSFVVCWCKNIEKSINIFDKSNIYDGSKFAGKMYHTLTPASYHPNIKLSYLSEKEYKLFDNNFTCSIHDKINNSSNSLQCELNNETDKTILEHFLNYINSFSPIQTIGTKITIFKLSIKKNIKKEEIPNPEYSLWTAKLDLIKSHTSENKEKETQNEINNIICDSMPPKTISKKSIVKELSVKEIKKIYRDIKSLYIDKQNKMLLKDNLEQFKNDKETLFQMGIDNKLNILLYGEPGTGKTTTIQTIASYLGKDIYYVNLKEFETNSDIQMIYDYISKNTGNGIIVYEDIDCMSDVVLKRTSDIKEISINDICDIENDKLSLSYFLNLLQGCLTPDDSINILTTNFKDKLDSAIFRSGRMDLTLELKPCSHFQIRNIFRKLMKREINEDVLKKIPEYKHTPATIIYHLKNYRKCTTMSDMDIFQNNFSE
jgi:hypothetical protein